MNQGSHSYVKELKTDWSVSKLRKKTSVYESVIRSAVFVMTVCPACREQMEMSDNSGDPVDEALSKLLGSTRSTLILFPPKNYPDHYIRSVSYHFDEVYDDLSRAAYHLINGQFFDDREARKAYYRSVRLSDSAVLLDMTQLRKTWTFVLIDDVHLPDANSRTVYTGLVSNPVSADASRACSSPDFLINPEASFAVTHVTAFKGDINRTNSSDDCDLFPDPIKSVRKCDNLFLLDPSVLLQNRNNGSNVQNKQYAVTHSLTGMTGYSVLQPAWQNIQIWHFKRIFHGLITAAQLMKRAASAGLQHNDSLSLWSSLMMTGTHVFHEDHGRIRADRPFSFPELQKMLPEMQIKIAEEPYDYPFGVTDTGGCTELNMAISMITSSLPSILADNGCFYTELIWYGVLGGIRISRMRPFVPYAGWLKNRIAASDIWRHSILRRLVRELYSVFYGVCISAPCFQNICCRVTCSIAGDTIVHVYTQTKEFNVVQCNRFGGINSCMVGSDSQRAENLDQLLRLGSILSRNPAG